MSPPPPPPPTEPHIPLIYRLFFHYIEPISTIVGFYYAWFQPHYYLLLTHAVSAPSSTAASFTSTLAQKFSFSTLTPNAAANALVPLGTHVALRQLANLYLAFTLNEALVLRCTNDLRVWRTLLFGLLVADIGHLYSCAPLGWGYYVEFWNWNAIAWGNIAFVYCGATLRTCFLLGVGLGGGEKVVKKVKAKAREIKAKEPVNAIEDAMGSAVERVSTSESAERAGGKVKKERKEKPEKKERESSRGKKSEKEKESKTSASETSSKTPRRTRKAKSVASA